MMRIKRLAVLAVSACMLMALGGKARAQMGAGMGDLSPEEQEKVMKAVEDFTSRVNQRLAHRFVTRIDKVEHSPASPSANQPVTVKAVVRTPSESINKVNAVELHYSVDQGPWLGPIAMSGSGANYSGTIPPLGKPGAVVYYVSATDTDGNVTANIPCKVSEDPPFMDACMITVSQTGDVMDAQASVIENDLDIWEIRAGYDDEYFYLQQSVEGSISRGTLSPLKINMYLSILLHPEQIKELDNIMTLMGMDPGKAEEYADMARFLSYAPLLKNITDQMPACALMGGKGGMMAKPDAENIRCQVDGPDLVFKVKRDRLGDAYKNGFMLVGALTGFVDNPSLPLPNLKEFSKYSMITFGRNGYTVK